MSSAVTSYFVYCGEGGLSVSDTNTFIDAMSKRMWLSHDGVKLHDLYIVTDEDSEQFYQSMLMISYRLMDSMENGI